MFAQGYTGAEDRLFLMDVLRHYGRARLSEFLGASPSNIHMDREQLAIAPYTEADLTAQVLAFQNGDAENQAIAADALAYVDGVNQYITEALSDPTKLPAEYPALQQLPATWKPEDIVAIASLVGGIFGKGGGGELTNYCGLQAMEATLGSAATARAIFDDLHFKNDIEAPVTLARSRAVHDEPRRAQSRRATRRSTVPACNPSTPPGRRCRRCSMRSPTARRVSGCRAP